MSETRTERITEYLARYKMLVDLSRVQYNHTKVLKYFRKLNVDEDHELNGIDQNELYEMDNKYYEALNILDPDLRCEHESRGSKSLWVWSVREENKMDKNKRLKATMVCGDDACLQEAIEWAKRSCEPIIYVYEDGNLIKEIENDFDPKSISDIL